MFTTHRRRVKLSELIITEKAPAKPRIPDSWTKKKLRLLEECVAGRVLDFIGTFFLPRGILITHKRSNRRSKSGRRIAEQHQALKVKKQQPRRHYGVRSYKNYTAHRDSGLIGYAAGTHSSIFVCTHIACVMLGVVRRGARFAERLCRLCGEGGVGDLCGSWQSPARGYLPKSVYAAVFMFSPPGK